MLWHLKHSGESGGDSEGFLAAVQERWGREVKELEQKPEMTPYIVWWIETYFLLDSSRQITMNGPGGIPLSEVTTYANHFDTPSDSLYEFCYIIQRMDATYLKHVKEEQGKEQGRKRPSKGASRK